MNRAVCCVATTSHYQRGMERLARAVLPAIMERSDRWMAWNHEPEGCPLHADVPYAMKAFALKESAATADLLLWCDASILPIRSLEPLWERIERDGYWISRNGWTNYEWTADSAYPDLFPDDFGEYLDEGTDLDRMRKLNRTIEHVVATTFGLNVKHPKGKAFLDEYYRLASRTKAFCGPWWNEAHPDCPGHHEGNPRFSRCGPSDVRGHRHDQTAASVIAWRLGMQLTSPPDIFAYSKRRPDGTLHLSDQDERTILLADGSFHDGVVL
jgi:hypothetical protein